MSINIPQGASILPSEPFASIYTPSVTGLALPTVDSQAANKLYVDDHISSGSGITGSVQFKGTNGQLNGSDSLIYDPIDNILYTDNISSKSGPASDYVTFSSGNAVADNSGSVYIYSGAAIGYRSGEVNIYTGLGQTSGSINLYTNPSDQPGSINIKPGTSTNGNPHGLFTITIAGSMTYVWPTTSTPPVVGSVLSVSSVSTSVGSSMIYLDWLGPI